MSCRSSLCILETCPLSGRCSPGGFSPLCRSPFPFVDCLLCCAEAFSFYGYDTQSTDNNEKPDRCDPSHDLCPLYVDRNPPSPQKAQELSSSYSSMTVHPYKMWVPEAGFPRPGADGLSAGASCPEAIPATSRNRIGFSCAAR